MNLNLAKILGCMIILMSENRAVAETVGANRSSEPSSRYLSETLRKVVAHKQIIKPRLIEGSCSKFIYPTESHNKKEEGLVALNLFISSNGVVTDSQLVSSSGSKMLDEAASITFSKCTFKPAKYVNGTEIDQWVRVTYLWELSINNYPNVSP